MRHMAHREYGNHRGKSLWLKFKPNMKSNTKPLNKNHVMLLPYTQSIIFSSFWIFVPRFTMSLVSNKSKKSEKGHFSAVRISISENWWLVVDWRRVFHLRTTILPAEEDFPVIMSSFKKFNDSFMNQYEGYSRMWEKGIMVVASARIWRKVACLILPSTPSMLEVFWRQIIWMMIRYKL
jgi:hypothetical protein